jgi:magnesium transporter
LSLNAIGFHLTFKALFYFKSVTDVSQPTQVVWKILKVDIHKFVLLNYIMGKNNKTILSDPSKQIVKVISPIISALNPLGKKENGVEETKKGKIRILKHNNITWVNVEHPTKRETSKLAEAYKFHWLHLETSLLKGQPPQIEKEEKYLFIVLHAPNYDSEENKFYTDQVSMFLGKNYLVTIHDAASSIHNQFRLCKTDLKLREAFFKRSSGYLSYLIIGNLVKDTEVLTQSISKELDEVEDIVFDVTVSGVHKLSQLRQKIIRLRRILGSFKKTLEDITPIINDFTGENLSRYFGNLAKKIDRSRETAQESLETVEVYKDADHIISSEKTNEILAVLTIVFTLTIPATTIGTLYGMNVLLPGGIEAGAWTFWGPYTTFIIVISISIALLVLMLLYFKHKKYF